jgi:hypothetical protein
MPQWENYDPELDVFSDQYNPDKDAVYDPSSESYDPSHWDGMTYPPISDPNHPCAGLTPGECAEQNAEWACEGMDFDQCARWLTKLNNEAQTDADYEPLREEFVRQEVCDAHPDRCCEMWPDSAECAALNRSQGGGAGPTPKKKPSKALIAGAALAGVGVIGLAIYKFKG